ncbi:hypothetical protein LOTGIDRAFT_161915 [Lottia gigantea]|uniref:Uncharacterized protein n=1 Tax=Lottia gigantea TaxID=225164 RepID=V4AE22_LOTGI|nr:hypothetical protein LOTGIDRAFT_161915 [Lottia gigantea]ESO93350.1 hypothetical protein LOTGIDRAFT_161915 [Lottia gigantea]
MVAIVATDRRVTDIFAKRQDTLTGEEEEFIDWLESFEACAAVNKWTDEEKCQFVAIKLKGSARKVRHMNPATLDDAVRMSIEWEAVERDVRNQSANKPTPVVSDLTGAVGGQTTSKTDELISLMTKLLSGRSTPLGNRLVTFSESVISANGETIHILGEVRLTFQLGYADIVHRVLVAPDLAQSCILGLDFLGKSKAVIDTHSRKLMIDGKTIPLRSTKKSIVCRVSLAETVTIPGGHEMILPGKLLVKGRTVSYPKQVGMVEGSKIFSSKSNVAIARVLVISDSGGLRILLLGRL